MQKRPLSVKYRLVTIFLAAFLIVGTFIPGIANAEQPAHADRACTRFSLAQGKQSETGVAYSGRFEMRQANSDRVLATWEATRGEIVSDWIDDITVAHQDGVWVEVLFFPQAQPATKLTVLNNAPDTEYGWIAPGQCHAVEVEYDFLRVATSGSGNHVGR